MGRVEPVSDFLAGGGEVGDLTRAFDGSSTSRGSPETWRQGHRVTVRLGRNSGQPLFVGWVPDLTSVEPDAHPLAALSAVAAQTFRDTSRQSALEIYQGRLAAFGRAHDLLTASHWIEAQLHEVVQTALAPYRTDEGRFDIPGPATIVRSRQALS